MHSLTTSSVGFCSAAILLAAILSPQSRAAQNAPTATAAAATAPAQSTGEEALLARWLAAIAAQDLKAYQLCLHPEARKVPEYGSAEAMAFWSKQIADLRKSGFTGQFEFKNPAEVNARFPAGARQAHPLVKGKAIGECILLLQVDGEWFIARLFS